MHFMSHLFPILFPSKTKVTVNSNPFTSMLNIIFELEKMNFLYFFIYRQYYMMKGEKNMSQYLP